jgi:hypothetical protein
MRRFVLLGTVIALMATAAPALAGNAHFVGGITTTRDGNSLTVSGKIAGLGNETQITVVISVDAACVNPGSRRPQADNKQTITTETNVPVQNGKADFSVIVTANFQPNCTPPMTVVFTNLVVSVPSQNLSRSFPGPF